MAQTVTLSKEQYNKLMNRVNSLEQTVYSLVDQLKEKLDIEPPYGSDQWWEWSDKKATEEIERGETSGPFTSAKDLQKFLDSLK